MERELRYAVFTPIVLENADGEDKPKWNMVAKPVKSRSHAYGDFELTTEMFHQAVKNFKLRSTPKLPINFDHFSPEHPNYDPNVGCPKQGDILDLQVRPDGCLWGLCDFKEPAKTYVKEEKYEYFSPEIIPISLDRETGKPVGMRLKGVALVTDPHLYDMPRVRASNDERENQNTLTSETETDKTKEQMSKELVEKVAELETKIREKDLKIAEITLEHKTKLSEVQANLDNKSKEFDKLVSEVVDGDVELAFNTYKDARKLSDTDKTHLKVMRLANAESFRALFPVQAPVATAARTVPAVRQPVQRPAYVSTNLSNETRPEADTVVKLSQSELHTKYMKEGLDSNQAALKAAKEVRGKLWHHWVWNKLIVLIWQCLTTLLLRFRLVWVWFSILLVVERYSIRGLDFLRTLRRILYLSVWLQLTQFPLRIGEMLPFVLVCAFPALQAQQLLRVYT